MRRGMALKYTSRSRATGSSMLPSRSRMLTGPFGGPTVPIRCALTPSSPASAWTAFARSAGQVITARPWVSLNNSSCGVRREVQVHAESYLLVRTAHRDLRECDAQATRRAIVRRTVQPTLRTGHEQLDEATFGLQIDFGRLPARKIVAHFPERRPAELGLRVAKHEDRISGNARMTRHRAVGA